MKTLQILAMLALAANVAHAQPPGGPMPEPAVIAKLLNLDAQRAEQLEAVLENARERMVAAHQQIGRPTDDATRGTLRAAMQAIRADTDKQLAEFLTPDELAKMRDALPPPPRTREGKRLGI